jgi:hypothetical protein
MKYIPATPQNWRGSNSICCGHVNSMPRLSPPPLRREALHTLLNVCFPNSLRMDPDPPPPLYPIIQLLLLPLFINPLLLALLPSPYLLSRLSIHCLQLTSKFLNHGNHADPIDTQKNTSIQNVIDSNVAMPTSATSFVCCSHIRH